MRYYCVYNLPLHITSIKWCLKCYGKATSLICWQYAKLQKQLSFACLVMTASPSVLRWKAMRLCSNFTSKCASRTTHHALLWGHTQKQYLCIDALHTCISDFWCRFHVQKYDAMHHMLVTLSYGWPWLLLSKSTPTYIDMNFSERGLVIHHEWNKLIYSFSRSATVDNQAI